MAQTIGVKSAPATLLDEKITEERLFRRFFRGLTPYLLISPFFIGFILFQVFPIGFSIFLSTQEWNPYKQGSDAFEYVGTAHFETLFDTPRFWNSLRVTGTITVVCVTVGTTLAVILAVLIDSVPDWLSNILRAVFFMPSVTSVVVITFIWKQLLNRRDGIVNDFLVSNHIMDAQNFLGDSKLALWSIIVMLIWAGLGWDALIITSSLRSIPQEYYEAARIDGAGNLTQFRFITLPLLRPVLLFVVTTGCIFLIGLFAQVQLLTGGNPLHRTETVSLYLYEQAFGYQEFGYASAIAVTLTMIMFAVSFANFKFFGGNREADI